jgi:hypothetical protein
VHYGIATITACAAGTVDTIWCICAAGGAGTARRASRSAVAADGAVAACAARATDRRRGAVRRSVAAAISAAAALAAIPGETTGAAITVGASRTGSGAISAGAAAATGTTLSAVATLLTVGARATRAARCDRINAVGAVRTGLARTTSTPIAGGATRPTETVGTRNPDLPAGATDTRSATSSGHPGRATGSARSAVLPHTSGTAGHRRGRTGVAVAARAADTAAAGVAAGTAVAVNPNSANGTQECRGAASPGVAAPAARAAAAAGLGVTALTARRRRVHAVSTRATGPADTALAARAAEPADAE